MFLYKKIIILLILTCFLQSFSAREGLFFGVGIGLRTVYDTRLFKNIDNDNTRDILHFLLPWEFGYGIKGHNADSNLLIYYPIEMSSNFISQFGIKGIGISYYINKNNYIKYSYGIGGLSYHIYRNQSGFRGMGYSIGYGYSFSLEDSIEITYTKIHTNTRYYNTEEYDYKNTFSSIGIVLKHRGFFNLF